MLHLFHQSKLSYHSTETNCVGHDKRMRNIFWRFFISVFFDIMAIRCDTWLMAWVALAKAACLNLVALQATFFHEFVHLSLDSCTASASRTACGSILACYPCTEKVPLLVFLSTYCLLVLRSHSSWISSTWMSYFHFSSLPFKYMCPLLILFSQVEMPLHVPHMT